MKYLLILSAILLFSCKNGEDDPQPARQATKYTVVYMVNHDATQGPFVDVVFNLNGKIDTLNMGNGSGFSLMTCYSTDVLSFTCNSYMTAFVKAYGGKTLEENVYLREDDKNYIHFDLSTIQ